MTRIVPPKGAQRRAARALKIRAELPASRRAGLTPAAAARAGIRSGVTQAKRIAAGQAMDVRPIRRFFSRFAGIVDRARAQGHSAHTSKAILAWDLWGGDEMARAVFRRKYDRP